jgi:hypothetical protein
MDVETRGRATARLSETLLTPGEWSSTRRASRVFGTEDGTRFRHPQNRCRQPPASRPKAYSLHTRVLDARRSSVARLRRSLFEFVERERRVSIRRGEKLGASSCKAGSCLLQFCGSFRNAAIHAPRWEGALSPMRGRVKLRGYSDLRTSVALREIPAARTNPNGIRENTYSREVPHT